MSRYHPHLFLCLLGASACLGGCGAVPALLGFGGAAAARASEVLAFPNVSAAIVPWGPPEVFRAASEALYGLGIGRGVVQERAGVVETIEATLDGRVILVSISPALDGRASRVTVQARSTWFQTDDVLQATILAAIMEKLREPPVQKVIPIRKNG